MKGANRKLFILAALAVCCLALAPFLGAVIINPLEALDPGSPENTLFSGVCACQNHWGLFWPGPVFQFAYLAFTRPCSAILSQRPFTLGISSGAAPWSIGLFASGRGSKFYWSCRQPGFRAHGLPLVDDSGFTQSRGRAADFPRLSCSWPA